MDNVKWKISGGGSYNVSIPLRQVCEVALMYDEKVRVYVRVKDKLKISFNATVVHIIKEATHRDLWEEFDG